MSTATLHPYAVSSGALTITVQATGAADAIARAMELHGCPFTDARRLA